MYIFDFFVSMQPWIGKILNHPFIQEMGAGTLCIERFSRYMEQDALYLVEFSQALAVLGTKAESLSTIATLSQLEEMALLGEQRIYKEFFLKTSKLPSNEKKSACCSYTTFLLSSVSDETFPLGFASLVPCFWIYWEIGRVFDGRVEKNNPYKRWLDLYASPVFAKDVRTMLDLYQKIWKKASSKERNEMKEVFEQSVRFEYAFWNEAYYEQACNV